MINLCPHITVKEFLKYIMVDLKSYIGQLYMAGRLNDIAINKKSGRKYRDNWHPRFLTVMSAKLLK